MKHRAVWIFLLGVLVGIALSVLYKHFVTDRIMDRDGMENPDFAYPLDGDRTYVDNSALCPVKRLPCCKRKQPRHRDRGPALPAAAPTAGEASVNTAARPDSELKISKTPQGIK